MIDVTAFKTDARVQTVTESKGTAVTPFLVWLTRNVSYECYSYGEVIWLGIQNEHKVGWKARRGVVLDMEASVTWSSEWARQVRTSFITNVGTDRGGFSYVIPIATMVATYATYVGFYLFKETYLTQ